MIKVEVQPYCSNCPNFEPDVEVEKTVLETMNYRETISRCDTYIRCEHANKCKNMMRYLQTEGKKNDV